MGKRPLVEVLGSFISNGIAGKSCVKYCFVDDGISMHNDAGMKFSKNFSHRKIGKFPVYLRVPVLGWLCTQEIIFVKFGHLKNSHEMWDQKYQKHHCQ